ncbi:MAG: ABC transporter ATP-binding protein [Candidatus Omnitrophica bacterium]|nr:ABC transporter ATP-binding protein [Candidatus Omnitrophota bacterium]
MLEVKDIHTYYGESYILQGVSLEVKKGTVVALMGRNGMGKTTTIRSIIGFAPPRQGTIFFKGENITNLETYKIIRMGMGLVPQGRRVFPSLSVEENLTMAATTGGKTEAWTLDKVYSFFPALKARAKVGGTRLSGGEQQMLCIARALMTNPDLLLMDEPSEGLAPVVVQQVSQIICQLKATGISILLVEQNFPLALSVSDYFYVINKGMIVYESTPDKIKDNEEIKAKYIGITRK